MVSPGRRKGDSQAQDNLGMMYEDGSEGHYDKVEAYKWFLLSAGQGNRIGQHDLMELQRTITSQQISDAERLVSEFHAQSRTNQAASSAQNQAQ